jgi:hypothetical protein
MFGRKSKPKHKPAPDPDRVPSAVRRFPWYEAIGTITVALFFYFVLHNHEAAEIFAIAGGLLTLGRLGYAEIAEHSTNSIRKPLDQIREFLDVSQASQGGFRDMLQVYTRITEEEFRKVKEGIIEEAREKLLHLANDKKSEILSQTRYYSWLLPMVEKTAPGRQVFALSMMREPEWDDSKPERDFIRLMKEAAERGVQISRIFVMDKSALPTALANPAITIHKKGEKPNSLVGYYVDLEELKKSDPELLNELGDGFILFDDRVSLVDVFSKSGARGYVTMNGAAISHLRDIFDRLMILARDLEPLPAPPVSPVPPPPPPVGNSPPPPPGAATAPPLPLS